jgi:hypothetical protein
MTLTIIPYPKFLTKPWRCMALSASPAACMSLLSLPQRRCAFAAALPEGCVARLWRVSVAAPHTVLSSSAALYSVFCSFAAVHSRQSPSSRCCSSATDHCCHPLTCLHRSAPPLVSRRRPPPHPTQVARPQTRIWHLSLLRRHVRYTLFRCHTVVAPPPPSSLDSHRHRPLRCRVVAPPPPLDSC